MKSMTKSARVVVMLAKQTNDSVKLMTYTNISTILTPITLVRWLVIVPSEPDVSLHRDRCHYVPITTGHSCPSERVSASYVNSAPSDVHRRPTYACIQSGDCYTDPTTTATARFMHIQEWRTWSAIAAAWGQHSVAHLFCRDLLMPAREANTVTCKWNATRRAAVLNNCWAVF